MSSQFILEDFTAPDIVQLQQMITSDQINFYWSFQNFAYPLIDEEFKRHLLYANYDGSSRKVYKIVDFMSGHSVGHLELDAIDYVARNALLGRLLVSPKIANQHVCALQSMIAGLSIAFDGMGMHRVWVTILDENRASIMLNERLGFKKEGHFRDSIYYQGKFYSYYIYSMLEAEWRQIKEGLD